MKFLKDKKAILLLITGAVIVFTGFKNPEPRTGESIRWMSFDQAVKLNKTQPKKIFIDVYTQWCGWCKKMDISTYKDPSIISYMNKYFYAVRLDAETKDTFHFDNHIFTNPATERGSVNELAYSLLDGKMMYPTTIYMDEKFSRLSVAPGYLDVNDMKTVLTYFAENKYKTMTFDDYKALMAKSQPVSAN